ncbi:gluconate:H+ symporter [Jatrophihabitans sp.]|uniref:GntT/GntP/DsdX family permease n=1 Tax=Jatrophihabitans sp. TaxID=1932789 RepID=UPI0030C754E7|nr:gluconate transporter [Jatrophihabitans sp.]
MTGTLVAAAATHQWGSHDTRLTLVTLGGIALIVLLIVLVKMHPFLALILGSAFVGLAGGVPLPKIISNFETGVGATLQEVGLLIALGAMLGKLLADSGGADRVMDTLLSKASPKVLPWAMALVAIIIGIPMFFEIGLVLLLPVIVLVAHRSGLRLMRIAIPALAGLSVLHGLIPPHPGPLIAIAAVHAQLGTTLALGIVVAIPTVILCGPLLSIAITRLVPVDAPTKAGGIDVSGGTDTAAVKTQHEDVTRPPSFGITLTTILFPVALMLSKALADIVWNSDKHPPMARTIFDFIGEPLVALVLAVLLAMITFGYAVGLDGGKISSRLSASVAPVASVILIVGAGGGFKQTLIGAGVGDSVAKFANNSHISILVLGYLVAVALRLATGSATVATITASGIVAPLAGSLSPTHLALLALIIGAGSLFLSHVNDAGFWLVKESFGLTVGQTFKSWSLMETAVSLVAFSFIMALSTIL